jgi:hypothetical protein
MSIAWIIFIALAITLTIKEARKEKQDFIKRNGMTRNQLFRACKYMRGENGKVSYRELLQNMNNN